MPTFFTTHQSHCDKKNDFRKPLAFAALTAVLTITGCADKPADVDDDTQSTAVSTNPAATGKLDFDAATLATGGASGPYNEIGIALTNTLNKEYGANTTTQTTGASVENLTLISQGQAQMAFAMSDVVSEALLGQDHFSMPIDNIQQVAVLYPNYVQIVTAKDSGIKNFEDLRGKRIAVGAKDSGVEVNARKLLRGFGMSYEDVEVDYHGYEQAVKALAAGTIDAAFLTSGLPNASLLELSKNFDLQLVSIDPDKIAEIAEDQPYFVAEYVPAGMYGDKNAISTAAIMNSLVVSADMSEDDVYKLTKTLFEKVDALRAAHVSAASITPEIAQQHLVAPLHPGAEKYYNELAGK